jgi:4-hydroxybenzoate polyprenyltransferase
MQLERRQLWVVAAAALVFALAGAFAYNDLRDQACDRLNRPARPLVSGRVSARGVRRLVALSFGASLALAAATMSPATVAFVVALALSALLYSDGIKRLTGVKNVFVGAWCGLLPWAAALDGVRASTMLPAVVLVALFATQKEVVADVYDREGDAAAGVRTIPVLAGPRAGLALVAALCALLGAVAFTIDPRPPLAGLALAARGAAVLDVAFALGVLAFPTRRAVRAYLELQKAILVGGCIGLFLALAR